jgi:hypothetical protein
VRIRRAKASRRASVQRYPRRRSGRKVVGAPSYSSHSQPLTRVCGMLGSSKSVRKSPSLRGSKGRHSSKKLLFSGCISNAYLYRRWAKSFGQSDCPECERATLLEPLFLFPMDAITFLSK